MRFNRLIFALLLILAMFLIIPYILSQNNFDPNDLSKSNYQVPDSYSGDITIKDENSVTIGGKQFKFSKGAKVNVKGGRITSVVGTLEQGTINGVSITNGVDITVSTGGNTISGTAGENCNVDGNHFEKDSKFVYNKNTKVMRGVLNEGILYNKKPIITQTNPETKFVGEDMIFKLRGKEIFTLDTKEPTRIIIDGQLPTTQENYVYLSTQNKLMKINGKDIDLRLNPTIKLDNVNVNGRNVKLHNNKLTFTFNGAKTSVQKPWFGTYIPITVTNEIYPKKSYFIFDDGSYIGALEVSGGNLKRLEGISMIELKAERAYTQLFVEGSEVPQDLPKRSLSSIEQYLLTVENGRAITQKRTMAQPVDRMLKSADSLFNELGYQNKFSAEKATYKDIVKKFASASSGATLVAEKQGSKVTFNLHEGSKIIYSKSIDNLEFIKGIFSRGFAEAIKTYNK